MRRHQVKGIVIKAAIVTTLGQPPAYGEFAEPSAGPGEVLIDVTAAALGPLARDRASGTHYSADGGLPFVVGVDGVGRLQDGKRVDFLLPRAPFGATPSAPSWQTAIGCRCPTVWTTQWQP